MSRAGGTVLLGQLGGSGTSEMPSDPRSGPSCQSDRSSATTTPAPDHRSAVVTVPAIARSGSVDGCVDRYPGARHRAPPTAWRRLKRRGRNSSRGGEKGRSRTLVGSRIAATGSCSNSPVAVRLRSGFGRPGARQQEHYRRRPRYQTPLPTSRPRDVSRDRVRPRVWTGAYRPPRNGTASVVWSSSRRRLSERLQPIQSRFPRVVAVRFLAQWSMEFGCAACTVDTARLGPRGGGTRPTLFHNGSGCESAYGEHSGRRKHVANPHMGRAHGSLSGLGRLVGCGFRCVRYHNEIGNAL